MDSSTTTSTLNDTDTLLEAGEIFCIAEWHEHFENAQTRRTQHLNHVLMPTRGNSGEYRRILSMPGGYQALAIWHLLIQFAAECPQRGLLVKATGPLDYPDLAFELGVPEADIRAAFKILLDPKIAWIEIDDCPQYLLVSGSLRSGRKQKVQPKVLIVSSEKIGPDFQQCMSMAARARFDSNGPVLEVVDLLTPEFRTLYDSDKQSESATRGVLEHGVDTPEMPIYPDIDRFLGIPEEEEMEESDEAESPPTEQPRFSAML